MVPLKVAKIATFLFIGTSSSPQMTMNLYAYVQNTKYSLVISLIYDDMLYLAGREVTVIGVASATPMIRMLCSAGARVNERDRNLALPREEWGD